MQIDLSQLEFIERELRKMVLSIEAEFGEQEITSLYRIGDTGVHGQLPLRGIDLRCHDANVGQAVSEYVNARWTYDPARPQMKCCVYHNVGLGYHLHLQVHHRTERID